MSRIWTPRPVKPLEVDDEGYVTRTVDRTLPIGQSYRIKPEDLLLAMGRMSRDGKTREQIRKELDVSTGYDAQGNLVWVTDAMLDRALARARAFLDAEIAAGRQPAETVTEERLPDDA